MAFVSDRTVLITGATDGIGRALATELLRRGMRVIIHGRDSEKLSAVSNAIKAEVKAGELHAVLADFSSLADVAALADRVSVQFPSLGILVNNAGLLTDHRQLSANGFELTFAVNYLAHFLLTLKLLPVLIDNAPARIVNVASTALGSAALDFNNLQMERDFGGWQAYANSKLMNVLFSNYLAARLAGTGVVSNALCPGLIDTNFFHTNTLFSGGQYERMQRHMRSPEEGALMPLYLAADPATADISGQFFIREGRDGRRVLPLDWDQEAAARLWALSVRYLEPWLESAELASLPAS
jgi:NAD(P)-dependent dehydrogenase (short-subunit alcohol dehydrogenase family)